MSPFHLEIKSGLPVYRQITDLLRDRIKTGVLVAGTRIPPIGKLAKQWRTNYFTVQTALLPLANEGLIESLPRKGTFVRSAKTTCTSIGLYFGVNFWRSSADGFYSLLFGILCDRLNQLNITPHLLIDSRSPAAQKKPWPPLLRAVEKRQIQGIIATMVADYDVNWLREVPVPVVLAWGGDYPSMVGNDLSQAVSVCLRRLKQQNCRSAGLITCDPALASVFEQDAAKLKISTHKDWIFAPDDVDASEAEGHRMFEKIWFQGNRPEGLLVYPDVLARGVMLAMLEHGVKVPRDIKAIFHLNAEMEFYCPLQVDWIATRATQMADALITSIQRQVEGAPPSKVFLPLELISYSEKSALRASEP